MLDTNADYNLSVSHNKTVSRRDFLLKASAVSALLLLPGAAWARGSLSALSDSFDLDDFLALSQEQLKQTDLSKDFAASIFKTFTDMGQENALVTLASGRQNPELSNLIVSTWYTGVSPNDDDPHVLEYTDALIWNALDYTKPMGFCGDGFGYWADPPDD